MQSRRYSSTRFVSLVVYIFLTEQRILLFGESRDPENPMGLMAPASHGAQWALKALGQKLWVGCDGWVVVGGGARTPWGVFGYDAYLAHTHFV